MNRREFLKGATSLSVGASVLPLFKVLPASAASQETAVVVIGAQLTA